MCGNSALLTAKFYANFLISRNCKKIIKIEQHWFRVFENAHLHQPPLWRDNDALITALRTPYVVTRHPKFAPLNSLGWSCYQNSPKLPEFGFFNKDKPFSQLYLHALTGSEVDDLNNRIEHNFREVQKDPWRIAFFTHHKENTQLKRFQGTFYKNLLYFVVNNQRYYLHMIENKLARVLDPLMYKKLKSWASQFKKYKIFIQPEPSGVSRRSIESYFHSRLPDNSTILSQPYMAYLNPPEEKMDKNLDPLLNLTGFSPTLSYNKTELLETNKLVKQIFDKTCYKYEKIKNLLKSQD